MAKILLIGTLDTKKDEFLFAKECAESLGCDVDIVDIGILKESPSFANFSNRDVLTRCGIDIESLRTGASEDRVKNVKIMTDAAIPLVKELVASGNYHGAMGMGGSGATNMFSEIVHELPIGFPKLLLSTMMSGDVSHYVGSTDLTMMYSVTDIMGINKFSERIISNASAAIAGMANKYERDMNTPNVHNKPLIAMTMFGITTPGVMEIRQQLESKGFEVAVFHATGAGGKSMEKLIEDGYIDGVIDYTVAELTDQLFGGIFPSDDTRFTSAGKKKIPQVIVPGALDNLNFGPVNEIPEKYRSEDRLCVPHNDTVCAVKCNADELVLLGEELAQRICNFENTAVVFPLGGLSAYSDGADAKWYDPEAHQQLFDVMKKGLNEVPWYEHSGNVNDKDFADFVVNEFLKLWKNKQSS